MKQYNIKSFEGKIILFATILASGMAFLDSSVVNIAIPTIQAKLNATISGIQWIVNGYALMLSSLILISGALGDRFGRKRIFSYGIVVFIVSSFLCSISSSITELALFRIIQGVGGAMMVPGSLSIINASFHESIRGRAIGLWSGFAGGVSALGPFLGGWLVQVLGWPSIFYINIPLGILALFLTLRFVPETKNHEATKIDLIGTLFIFFSLLGIVYGLITGSDLGFNNPLILVSIIVGLLFFLLFIYIERKVKEPLVPLKIFNSGFVTGANLVTLCLYFALSGVIFFFVLNLQQVQHYSPLISGLSMMPTILLITFLSGYGGTLADRIGPRIPMIIGPLIVSFGMFLLILPGKNANYLLQYFPGLVLFGVGMSIVIAPLTKSALSVEEKYSGAASGVNNAVARIAGLLAVALLGAIVLFIFEKNLQNKITYSKLNEIEKTQIMSQEKKMAGINVPSSFNRTERNIAQIAIEDAYLSGFKWAMGINALLAFLSGIISFFTIKNIKRNPHPFS